MLQLCLGFGWWYFGLAIGWEARWGVLGRRLATGMCREIAGARHSAPHYYRFPTHVQSEKKKVGGRVRSPRHNRFFCIVGGQGQGLVALGVLVWRCDVCVSELVTCKVSARGDRRHSTFAESLHLHARSVRV